MKQIILASQSKARKKLLTQMGLRFVTCATHVAESQSLAQGPQHLVMGNALAKARAAASHRRSGLVIAADTVILAGERLIGKPKSLADAQKIIKRLSRTPHWVYSGLAVIDIEENKTITAYEKTKVYMTHLTDKQIKDYCRRFAPLDKAGSFDIQGPGGMFVRRIEGCYYTVVGLPLAKLVTILGACNIDVFT